MQDDSLSQCPGAHVDGTHVQGLHASPGHDRPGDDLPTTGPRHTLQLVPLPGTQGGEPRDPGLQVSGGDAPTDKGPLPLGGRAGKPGELLERLRCADGPFGNPLPEQAVGDFPQGRVYVPAQCHQLVAAGRVVRQEFAGQPSRAERKRHRELRLGVPAEDDLHRAAADVEDQQPARRPAVPLADGQVGEPGLVLAAEVLGPDAGLSLHPVQDQVAVGGVAHGRGGEHVELLHSEPPGGVHGVVHRFDDPIDPGRFNGAVRAERLTEQGGRLHRVRRQRWRARTGLEDLQLGRVRTNIQDPEQHPSWLPSAGRTMHP